MAHRLVTSRFTKDLRHFWLGYMILFAEFADAFIVLLGIEIIFQFDFWSSALQTESEAYEPTVEKHRCAQKGCTPD